MLNLLKNTKELNTNLREQEKNFKTDLSNIHGKLIELVRLKIGAQIDKNAIIEITSTLKKFHLQNSSFPNSSTLETIGSIVNKLNEIGKQEATQITWRIQQQLNQYVIILGKIILQQFENENLQLIQKMVSNYEKLIKLDKQPTIDDFIDKDFDNFDKSNLDIHHEKINTIGQKIEEIQNYLQELEYLTTKMGTILPEEIQFDCEESAIEKFEDTIVPNLEKIQMELIQKQNQLKSALPLSVDVMVSKEKEIKQQSEIPKNAVIIRFFKLPNQEGKKIFGFRSDGHLSLEIIHEGKSVYLSLVTNHELLDPQSKSKLKLPGIPTNNIFKGQFQEKKGEVFEKDFFENKDNKRIIIDCSEEGSLDTQAMYEWGKNILDQYQSIDSKDFNRYPYQFFTNNCSLMVLNGLKVGGANQYSTLPIIPLVNTTTPEKAFNFAQDINIKLDKTRLDKQIQLGKSKSTKERTLDIINYYSTQIAFIDNQYVNYKVNALDRFIITLPSLETLKNDIKVYKINYADELIKITQVICAGVAQKLAQIDVKNTTELNAQLDYFYNALQILRDHIGLFDLTENSLEEKNLQKLREYIDSMIKQVLHVYQEPIKTKNQEYMSKLHEICNKQQNFVNSKKVHQTYIQSNSVKNDSNTVEAKMLNNVASNEKELSDIEVLFRSIGHHEPYGQFANISLTNTKWSMYDNTNEEKEVKELLQNSTICQDVFKKVSIVGQNSKDETEIKRYKKVQNVLAICMAPLEYSDLTPSSVKSNSFKKIIIARHALRKIYQLYKEDNDKLFNVSFYREASDLVSSYLGQIYQQFYFDMDCSTDNRDNDNLSLKMQKLILPKQEVEPSMQNFIQKARDTIGTHKKSDFSELADSYDDIKTKESIDNKPSVFTFWKWKKRAQLVELETRNQVSQYLKNQDLPPTERYTKIMAIIDKNAPSNLKPWRKEERQRYLELGHTAGLLCLLESFVKGHIEESQFIFRLKAHYQKYNIPDSALNDFIGKFREKYIKSLKDIENNDNNNENRVSFVDNYAEQLRNKPDLTKVNEKTKTAWNILQSPQTESNEKVKQAVVIEEEITREFYTKTGKI